MKFFTKPCRVIQPYSYPRTVLNTHKLSHNKKQQTFLISLGQRFKGLESGMVFEGTTGVCELIYRFNSKWVRKKEKYANSTNRQSLADSSKIAAFLPLEHQMRIRSDESDLCGIPMSFCCTINPLQWHMSTGSEFFSISQCRSVDATKLVFLSDQFPYRDDFPTKLGNITGRNIISCASLRNVFHWLSSLFKWYKSVLLKRKRDTRIEKTNKQRNKQRYHLKWCQSFFVFFECISCSPSWKQCTTWMIICLMTSCKGPIAHL